MTITIIWNQFIKSDTMTLPLTQYLRGSAHLRRRSGIYKYVMVNLIDGIMEFMDRVTPITNITGY